MLRNARLLFVYLIGLPLLLSAAGCSRTDPSPSSKAKPAATEPEQTFAEQLAKVTSKQTATIALEQAALTDQDLATIPADCILQVLKVDVPSSLTAKGLAHLANAPSLVHLRITGKLDSASVQQISQLTSLKILNLQQCEINDADLTQLASLPKLIQLRVESSHITDAGMEALVKSKVLLRLHLISCPITDESIARLGEMTQLESLYLDDIPFSDAAIEKLVTQRPQLHLHLNQLHHSSDQRPEHGLHLAPPTTNATPAGN